ncbi:MAG: hypothetical protein GY747_07500 [Planctomycetes bacterium]|nr:hypothetical protein [Planctomycetota bacterium]MCP4771055.1 hypothetical protein [Planctomycetota bacterium]MCP4861928.1 hypothetical protein [Planctomycetota bacterium]
MDIHNKTPRPLKIPLPGGKVLRLGPGKTGQITAKASEHPPVKKLIEDGTIEIVGDGGTHGTTGGSSDSGSSGPNQSGPSGGGAMRRSGDR